MITLAAFRPAFRLSDSSPFFVKAEMLLEMAGLAALQRRAALHFIQESVSITAAATVEAWRASRACIPGHPLFAS
jgi:hypothetical protein